MWEYKFTQEDVAEANNLAKHLARANLNSITKGEGHSAGKMGEIAVLNYNDRFKINDTFNNDLISFFEYWLLSEFFFIEIRGRLLEVKIVKVPFLNN